MLGGVAGLYPWGMLGKIYCGHVFGDGGWLFLLAPPLTSVHLAQSSMPNLLKTDSLDHPVTSHRRHPNTYHVTERLSDVMPTSLFLLSTLAAPSSFDKQLLSSAHLKRIYFL